MESPKVKELVNELHGVRAKWKAIGRQLEVSAGTLNSFGTVHRDDQGEALAQMLEESLKRTDPELFWPDIVEALRSASVGEYDTARKLERNRCPKRDTPCDYPAAELSAPPFSDEAVPRDVVLDVQLLPDHRRDEVPGLVREVVGQLAKQFNSLRIKAYRHVTALEKNQKVTANEFRFVISNPQRNWQGDDRQHVFMANSITNIFAVISVKRHLNWQNYSLLGEIIEEFGDANLKKDLETYRHELFAFESKMPLLDVKHIIFTPRGSDQGLMRVPLDDIPDPTLHTARCIQNGFHKNGFPTTLHHVGHNSPLALYFIVPRHLMPPTFKHAIIDSTAVEDHVVCTLSNDDVRQLLDLPVCDSVTPSDNVDSESVFCNGSITSEPSIVEERFPSLRDLHVFSDQIINTGDTAVVCKAQFFHLPCAAKYIHCSLSDSTLGHLDSFKKGCEILQSCCHPNILTVLSTYSDNRLPGHVMLMELMDKSLSKFLKDQKVHLPLHVQLNICSDVANGLEYLHAKKIIHGNLTATNVLLKDDRAKICGAMSLQHNTPDCELSLCPGAAGSLPRRSFSIPDYTDDIDSFSFGVLAMHVAILETPQPYALSEEGSEMKRFERSLEKVASKHPLHSLITKCLNDIGNLRPTAAELCMEFSEMQQSPWYRSSQSNEPIPIRQLALQNENKDLQIKLENKQAEIERLWLYKKQAKQRQFTAQRNEEGLKNRIEILALQNSDLHEKVEEATKQLEGAKKGRNEVVTEKDRMCKQLWKEREKTEIRDSKIKELEKDKATYKTQLEAADGRVAELLGNA